MFLKKDGVLLRPIEPCDAEVFYYYKNDYEIANLLGGFSYGYSKLDIVRWINNHSGRQDEIIWSIIFNDICIGHVALYKIDHRVGSAEFGIIIGEKSSWGKGVGEICTRLVIDYGFSELNLNRIYLSVLASNERAINLYKKIGFIQEGILRKAQYKNNTYIDVVLMAILRDEYDQNK